MGSTPKLVFITGATDGLGRALAMRVAAGGDRLLLHGRDPARLSAVVDEIAAAHGERPQAVVADLSDLGQVRRLAEEVADLTDTLDVFVSNAGVGSGEPDGRERRTSVDGFELRFAVNYLAGFLLTERLLALIEAAPQGRIVNVASLGQSPLDFDDLMLERAYSGDRAYGQSKLAQIISGFDLAARLPDASPVTVNSLHPATYMPTKMVLQEIGQSMDDLETGVEAVYRLVADPSLGSVTGQFFDRQRETKAHVTAYDPAVQAELRVRSLALVGEPADA
jgi:NAD(P)-dependent dehydrogenase (short-subunit alcohol dehydrogenase family)